MCLSNEAVDELHAITSAIKAEQEARDKCMSAAGDGLGAGGGGNGGGGHIDFGRMELVVTRAEAERIFADRIAAHEARLKEIGWSRTVRVESQPIPLPERNAT